MASHASDAPTHGKLTDNAGVLAAPIPPLTLTSSAVAVDSDTASTKEKDDTTATPPPEKGLDGEGDDGEDETEYVTGWKLFSLMAAVTLASFLMLLDMSIIVTVRQVNVHGEWWLICSRLGYSENNDVFSFAA